MELRHRFGHLSGNNRGRIMICFQCKKEFDEYKTEEKVFVNGSKHIAGYCPHCGKWIKFLPQGGEDMLYFGKHKGEKISEVAKNDREYLIWLKDNFAKHSLKKKIEKYL